MKVKGKIQQRRRPVVSNHDVEERKKRKQTRRGNCFRGTSRLFRVSRACPKR